MLLAGHRQPQEILSGYTDLLTDKTLTVLITQSSKRKIVFMYACVHLHFYVSTPCVYAISQTCLPQGEVVLALYG